MNAPQIFKPSDTKTDMFWYPTSVAGLSSVAPTASSLINLDADSYFYCVALTCTASIAGAAFTESTAPLPLVSVQIQDTGTGKYMMSGGVLIPGLFGDGKRPYRLPRPRVFNPNGTINFTYDGSLMAAGTTYQIQLVLHGFKQYL